MQGAHGLGDLTHDGAYGPVAQRLAGGPVHVVPQGHAGIWSGDDQGDPVPGVQLVDRSESAVLAQRQAGGVDVDQIRAGRIAGDKELAVPVQHLVLGPPDAQAVGTAEQGDQGVSAEDGVSDMRVHACRALIRSGASPVVGDAVVDRAVPRHNPNGLRGRRGWRGPGCRGFSISAGLAGLFEVLQSRVHARLGGIRRGGVHHPDRAVGQSGGPSVQGVQAADRVPGRPAQTAGQVDHELGEFLGA